MWSAAGNAISISRALESGPRFTFAAEDVRREGSGIHCRVWITQDQTTLVWGKLNIEDASARQWIANKAYEKLGAGEQQEWPKRLFGHEFDAFCANIWPQWIGRIEAAEVGGDPSIGPVGYLLRPYVLEEGGVIAFAPPGAGKSWLMYLMAQSIEHGVETPYWRAEQRSVLVVNLERPDKSVRRRMTSVNAVLGLPPETTLPVISARGRTLMDVLPVVEKEMQRRQAHVLFLDSLSRAGYGKLIADEVANSAMDTLNQIAESWFLVAHPPRADATHTFGSVMFDAAADLLLQVSAEHREDSGTMGIALKGTKANDIPLPKLTIFAMQFDQHGLADFRRAKRNEFPDLEKGRRQSLADELHGFLLGTGAMSATEIAEELGRNRPSIVEALRGDRRFQVVRKDGKKVLYGVTSDTSGNTNAAG